MSEHPPIPTGDDCGERRRFDWNGHACMALWYPQMGGYVGRAVAVSSGPVRQVGAAGFTGGCFDVYVWHDGEFPFDDSDEFGRGPVRRLHHCDPQQFIQFGEQLDEFQAAIDALDAPPVGSVS